MSFEGCVHAEIDKSVRCVCVSSEPCLVYE